MIDIITLDDEQGAILCVMVRQYVADELAVLEKLTQGQDDDYKIKRVHQAMSARMIASYLMRLMIEQEKGEPR